MTNRVRSIRFIKNFVLFITRTELKDGQISVEEEQHHVTFGEHHQVKRFSRQGENIIVDFAESDAFTGTAIINKSNVEQLGGHSEGPTPASGGCGGCGKKRRKA
jgi:hypothetical protein